MRGRVNDWLRSAIADGIRVAGAAFSRLLRVRLRKDKGTLNRRHSGTGGRVAVTSGSAGDTKRIWYSNARLRRTKLVFSDMFARACRAFRIRLRQTISRSTAKYLPSPHYRLIPMYSMSTETIETVTYFDHNDTYFLPLAPGVVYEFLEEATPAHFIKPTVLEPGKLYEMIVGPTHLQALAAHCDQLLGEINCEYKSKRASGRLAPVTLVQTSAKEFAETFSSHNGWESQFKFLPLCPHLIENDLERVS